MPLHLEWSDIALRLALAFAAGATIGLNRSDRGHPAGLRTTLLVCLAAAVSMLQVNALLATGGRHPDSFMMLDLMRLPLGILSGMGFIGAGAILRKGNLVRGITTAATLWFVTVIGLCLGGGQIGLGLVSTALALIILWGLKWVEYHLPELRMATLTVMAGPEGPNEEEICAVLEEAGFRVTGCAVSYTDHGRSRKLYYTLRWTARSNEMLSPPVVDQLAQQKGVQELEWRPNSVVGELQSDTINA